MSLKSGLRLGGCIDIIFMEPGNKKHLPQTKTNLISKTRLYIVACQLQYPKSTCPGMSSCHHLIGRLWHIFGREAHLVTVKKNPRRNSTLLQVAHEAHTQHDERLEGTPRTRRPAEGQLQSHDGTGQKNEESCQKGTLHRLTSCKDCGFCLHTKEFLTAYLGFFYVFLHAFLKKMKEHCSNIHQKLVHAVSSKAVSTDLRSHRPTRRGIAHRSACTSPKSRKKHATATATASNAPVTRRCLTCLLE